MKSLKWLMLAALTILSVSVFAQSNKNTNNTTYKKSQQYYSCPMHPGETSTMAGKCSKCGMNLTVSSKEKMKMGTMKQYSCPMHPDVISNKPGKCPQCNMDLQKSNKTPMAYSCPMHPDVTSAKPGKCSRCRRNMNLNPKEKMKMEQ